MIQVTTEKKKIWVKPSITLLTAKTGLGICEPNGLNGFNHFTVSHCKSRVITIPEIM